MDRSTFRRLRRKAVRKAASEAGLDANVLSELDDGTAARARRILKKLVASEERAQRRREGLQ
jgi:hypothetical protein